MKIKQKFLLLMILGSVLPVIITSITLGLLATHSADDALKQSAQNQLVAIRETKKNQIQAYFDTIADQVLTLSGNGMTIDAMRGFSQAFQRLARPLTGEQQQALNNYYRDSYAASYADNNNDARVDIRSLTDGMSQAASFWQYQYIQQNPHPLGEKHRLDQATGGNAYDQLHARYHPVFREYLQRFEFYDIFLVDAATGHVVYSVFKEVDYATSLKRGPYASSGLADAYQQALQAGGQRSASLVDFKPYLPSYQAQASFISAPILDGERLIGVLVFQMPIDRINQIMTSDARWPEVGLGSSGETYLVGSDYKARSLSRFLLEDQAAFLAMLTQTGTDSQTVMEIAAKGSNIGLQTIRTQGTQSALSGESGFAIFDDYRAVSVLSAYTPLTVLGLDWALLSEIDEAEAFAAVNELNHTVALDAVIIVLLVLAIAAVLGLWVANRFTQPIHALSNVMLQVEKQDDLTLSSDIKTRDEIGEMAQSLNSMLSQFSAVVREVSENTRQVAGASSALTQTATDSAQGVMQQQAEIAQIATAIEQMTATLNEVADLTTDAASVASASSEQAKAGKQRVEQARAAIQSLSDNIQQADQVVQRLARQGDNIGSVTEVIKGIADQTNLLALNAAIEAARAGELGRGFAVVADEVRTLAQKTQSSIHEIEEMIEQIRQGTRDAVAAMDSSQAHSASGVELAENAAQSLDEIVDGSLKINDLNAQIASATEQQSVTAEQINRGVVNISEVAGRTAESSQASADSSRNLSQLADGLRASIERFKT